MAAARTTVICAVWHGDPDRAALVAGHRANLDGLTTPVDRVYVFDNGDTPLDELAGTVVIVREPLTIYQAWNVALAMVRTPLVMNLNLDDRLAPDAVGALEAAIDAGADLVGGDWRICYSQAETDAVVPCRPASDLPFVRSAWPPPAGTLTRLGAAGERGTRGPACLWRMSVHQQVPRYPWQFGDRTPIRVIGDLLFWTILGDLKKRCIQLPVIIGNYHSHPAGQAEFRGTLEADERVQLQRHNVSIL